MNRNRLLQELRQKELQEVYTVWTELPPKYIPLVKLEIDDAFLCPEQTGHQVDFVQSM